MGDVHHRYVSLNACCSESTASSDDDIVPPGKLPNVSSPCAVSALGSPGEDRTPLLKRAENVLTRPVSHMDINEWLKTGTRKPAVTAPTGRMSLDSRRPAAPPCSRHAGSIHVTTMDIWSHVEQARIHAHAAAVQLSVAAAGSKFKAQSMDPQQACWEEVQEAVDKALAEAYCMEKATTAAARRLSAIDGLGFSGSRTVPCQKQDSCNLESAMHGNRIWS